MRGARLGPEGNAGKGTHDVISDRGKVTEGDGAGNTQACVFYIQYYTACPEMVFSDVDTEPADSFPEGAVWKGYIPGVVVGNQLERAGAAVA